MFYHEKVHDSGDIAAHFGAEFKDTIIQMLGVRFSELISDTFYRRPSFDKEGGVVMAEGMGVISFGIQLLPYAIYGVGAPVGSGAD